jgi:hypothetical protein
MAWFKKETKTRFIRDAEGRVVDVEHEETQPKLRRRVYHKDYNGETVTRGAAPDYDRLQKQYYQEHPEKRPSARLKRAGTKIADSFGQMADNYEKNMKHARRASTRAKRGGRPTQYRIQNNYNPFGTLFDTGLQPYTQAKKTAKTTGEKTEYVIKGGVAYPIAKPKKKTPKKKTIGTGDFLDSHGFFR